MHTKRANRNQNQLALTFLNNLMLPNRCQFALISVVNGVVKPFVRQDTSFPLAPDKEILNNSV